jgi:hypothetical protein
VSAPLQSFVGWMLRVLPVNQPRPCEETLADWRSEAVEARGVRRVLVAARALWSIGRCVLMISVREIRSHEGLGLLLRLGAVALVIAAVYTGLYWNDSIPLDGTRVQLGPVPGALLAVATLLGAMPFVAFLSATVGRRRVSPVPRLGPALILGVLMFIGLGWLMPVTNQAYRELVFGLQSTTGTLALGINERSFNELVGLLFTRDAVPAALGLNLRIVFSVAAAVMLVLGVTARTLIGWRRFAASILPIAFVCLPLIPLFGGTRSLLLLWPALVVAALVTRTLARTNAKQEAV